MNKSRVDLTLLKQFLKTVEEQVEIADRSEDKNSRTIEYTKVVDVLSGMAQEISYLVNDIVKPPSDNLQTLFGEDILQKVKDKVSEQNRSRN